MRYKITIEIDTGEKMPDDLTRKDVSRMRHLERVVWQERLDYMKKNGNFPILGTTAKVIRVIIDK